MSSDIPNMEPSVSQQPLVFESFADKAELVFWMADPESYQIVYLTQFAENSLGIPLAAWQRPSFWDDHLYPGDREQVLESFAEAVASQETQELEYRLRAADGTLRWFRDKVCLLFHEGKPMLCGMMSDVTSFKTAVGHHVGLPGYTSVFLEIVRLLTDNVNIHERLQALAHRLKQMFGVTAVYIWGRDMVWGMSPQPAENIKDLRFLEKQKVDFHHQLSNLINELKWQQHPQLIVTHADDSSELDWKQKHLRVHQAKTILYVPIHSADRVIGCIEIIDRQFHHVFSESDLELCQIVAQQANIAITRAQLFQAEARRRREAEILLDVAEFVSGSLDRDEILARVMEILRVYLDDAHNFAISLISPDGVWLESVLSWWADEAYAILPKGERMKVEDTFSSLLALESGEPIVISDLQKVPFVNEFTKEQIKNGLRSIVCIPFKIQGRSLGTLHIHQWHEARHFTAEEIAVLHGVANQTAIAIENARLFANERQQLQLSQTLQQVGALLTASLPLEQVYDQIFELLGQVVMFDSASLFLWDHAANHYQMVASSGFDKSIFDKISRTLDAARIDQKIALTPGWAVIDDVSENPNWITQGPLDSIQAWIGALLRVKGETIGLLCVDSHQKYRYTAEDGRTVAAFANQAAVAIENARLAVETARQAKELAILNHVSQETAVSLNIDQFLKNVTDLVGQELYSDYFGFILHDEDAACLKPHSSFRGFETDIDLIEIPLDASITGHVLQTAEPYYAPDVSEDPFYFGIDKRVLSEIAIPLKVDGEIVGIIDAASSEGDNFSERDINFLTTLAGNISIVLERAKLYETLRGQAKRLAEQVAQRTAELKVERDRLFAILESAGESIILTDIEGRILYANPAMERQSGYTRKELLNQNPRILGSKQMSKSIFDEMWRNLLNQRSWTGEFINQNKDGQIYDVAVTITPINDTDGHVTGYVSVQSDITRLKELERLKTEFIANVSHQLRTPLTNIKTYVSLLSKGRPENFPRYFSVLHYEIDRLARLIQDLLDISRLDAEAVPDPEAAADFCDVWDLFWTPYIERAERENKRLHLDLADDVYQQLPEVNMESFQLEKIMSRLAENGLLYTPEKGNVWVSVDWAADSPGNLQLLICDDGPGIPEAERPFVFDRFFRGAAAIEAGLPGNGLGLAIVHELLNQYGGSIKLETTVGEGSCFTVLLPLVSSKMDEGASDAP